MENALSRLELQPIDAEPQQGRRAVEQLSCGIDGHRDVVTNVSRVGIWRGTWSAREVVRFAANEPRAWREERLARHAGEGIDKGRRPEATDRLEFLSEKPSSFTEAAHGFFSLLRLGSGVACEARCAANAPSDISMRGSTGRHSHANLPEGCFTNSTSFDSFSRFKTVCTAARLFGIS